MNPLNPQPFGARRSAPDRAICAPSNRWPDGQSEEETHMAHPNEEIVRQAYKAFGEGDMDTLRSLFAPDAVHSARGNNPIAGDYKGVDDILGFYGKLFELSDGTFRAELESTKADGDDKIVATHRNKAERGGK